MKEVNRILEQKGVRITAMRQILLEYFLKKNTPLGLTELEIAFPIADRITMYRTLKTFTDHGILHSIDNGTSEVKYALCFEHCSPAQHIDQHPHFHCSQCGEITCLGSVFIPAINLPTDYLAKEWNMTIKGICNKCHT